MRPKRTIPQDLLDNEVLDARFFSKIAIGEPTACWPFMWGRNQHGYGKFVVDGHVLFAHRVAWAIAHRQNVPDGLRILHRCDNPPCCNPAHLFLGTMSDNMKDMWNKNRHGRRVDPKVGIPCRGEAHHSAKLTPDDVVTIRRLAADGVPQRDLAVQYGVSQATISAIVRRIKWKHVA